MTALAQHKIFSSSGLVVSKRILDKNKCELTKIFGLLLKVQHDKKIKIKNDLKHNIKDIFREALVFNPFIPQIYIKKRSRKFAICISDDSALHKNNPFSYEWTFLFFNSDFLHGHCLWRFLGFPWLHLFFLLCSSPSSSACSFLCFLYTEFQQVFCFTSLHLLPEGLRKVI